MIEEHLIFKSKDDEIIWHRIYHVGCEFAEITFSTDETKKNDVIGALDELMIKLTKVVDELRLYETNKRACAKRMAAKIKKGVSAVSTHEIAKNLENFLTQSKGALDIFAKQFLKVMVNFNGKWSCHNIIKHIQNQRSLDKKAIEVMVNTLKRENDEWLKAFIDDRNLHHEKNIGLSPMYIVNKQCFFKLTRRNGKEVTDVTAYLRFHYNKVFQLIEHLMRLSFCAINPSWSVVYLGELQNPLKKT